MATTPEIIQQRFGVPAECGTVDVPRVMHAFRGMRRTDKRIFLGVVYSAVMKGALLPEGRNRNRLHPTSHEELAAVAGLRHRQSFTRWLSRFTPLCDQYSDVASRRAHAQNLFERAKVKYEMHASDCPQCAQCAPCDEGGKLKARIRAPREDRALPTPVPILQRSRQFSEPNRMSYGKLHKIERAESWIVVETKTGARVSTHYSSQRAGDTCEFLNQTTTAKYQVEAVPVNTTEFHFPTLEQLLADPDGREWWDENFAQEGFKSNSRWIWNPRIMDPDDTERPLGAIARMVMSAYEQFGFLDTFRDPKTRQVTKERGVLTVKQEVIAAYLGIDVKSVYKANLKWAKLGIIRVVHQRGETDGKRWSAPNKILYLPIRMLTEEEAAEERKRIQEAALRITRQEGLMRLVQIQEANRVHGELLRAWTGKEHCLGAFWKECGRQLVQANVARDIIQRLIPTFTVGNQRKQ